MSSGLIREIIAEKVTQGAAKHTERPQKVGFRKAREGRCWRSDAQLDAISPRQERLAVPQEEPIKIAGGCSLPV
jgi:hypothetical protein